MSTSPTDATPSIWKRTYFFIWWAQFFSIAGFAFALPFASYYIQELGVTDPKEIKLWVALFAAATPLALAVFSPLWGAAADRFGYRLMMLRANFSGVFVLALMGMVNSVETLIILRLLQGALTGTLTAAQVMVAAQAPPSHSSRAMGGLTSSVFSGAMCGAALGGISSAALGYRSVFGVAAGLLFISGLLILFGTRELPRNLDEEEVPPGDTDTVSHADSRSACLAVFPLLALISAISFARQFDLAMMALLVQEIHGSLDGVSVQTGAILTVSSLAGMLAGFAAGRISERVHLSVISIVLAIGAALTMFPQGLASSVWMLFPLRSVMVFCTAGLESIAQIWLARVATPRYKGIIFGWFATARSIGWVLAPLASGAIGAAYGLRPVYYAASVIFLILVPLVILANRKKGMQEGGARVHQP